MNSGPAQGCSSALTFKDALPPAAMDFNGLCWP